MNRLIETLKNIWKITELRNRILFTIMILAIYRFGAYVVLPGVVPSALEAARAAKSDTDILGLLNIFTGGAFFQGAIFALGIMPYITSSIIIQLLGFAVPYFQRLQQKEGESGRKKINQITRFLTLLITLVQGGAYLAQLNAMEAVDPSVNPALPILGNIIILSTGTVFAMWMGEKVTDKGIG
ncbi:MAG TPA: preprotein translocase subunit SecY, partial [Saprospirales bacterium]|nr:preprotein translocase subunit SecY [Saprospirales bacterium]